MADINFEASGFPIEYPRLVEGLNTTFVTPNNNLLGVIVTGRSVEVFDVNSRPEPELDWHYGFNVTQRPGPDSAGELELTVCTRSILRPDQRHPDFIPDVLMRSTIGYFDERGTPAARFILVMRDLPGLDAMYHQYRKLEQLFTDRDPSASRQAIRQRAAAATWTGRLITDVGFNEIIGVEDSGATIRAVFQRIQARYCLAA